MHEGGDMTHELLMTPATKALQRLLAMPPRWIERVAGPPPEVDGRRVDHAVHLLLQADRGRARPVHAMDVEQRRSNLRRTAALTMPRVTGVRVGERVAPGPQGPIRVRVYRSLHTAGPLPVIVYYHGGGWVVGDLESHDASCRMLARHSGCVVVAVDYRLAPEHPFPEPVLDAIAAYRWVRESAEKMGGIRTAVAVMGDSAGGNIAAAVCLATREEGPSPIAQALVYPATDLRMRQPSVKTFASGFFLEERDMQWYVAHYLPDPRRVTDPLASPLLADDLTRLPPASIWTAGFDPLRDEGRAYAARLADSAVPTTHRCLDDQIHGFFGLGVLPGGMRRIETVCREVGETVYRAAEA
jgi:acetyl esterase